MKPLLAVIFALLAASAFAGDNLKLNPKLDYSSDSQDGPLITGDNIDAGITAGITAGKPAYIILYGEGCYNSKHQARRTVSLYEKYKGRVQFVIVDLDKNLSPAQAVLRDKYYRGYIPHVVVLDSADKALYNSSGEVEENVIERSFEKALK
jgi:hypothetical protein